MKKSEFPANPKTKVCHLKDVPNNTYFYSGGRLYKKVRTNKRTSSIVMQDNWDNYLGVEMVVLND